MLWPQGTLAWVTLWANLMRLVIGSGSPTAAGYTLKARRIAGIYITAGLLWIAITDSLVHTLPQSIPLHFLKGTVFVLFTGGLLYLVLARAAASIRAAGAELIKGEERFRKLVENAPVGVFIHTGGRYRYMNAAALRIAGAHSFEQLRDQLVIDRLAPEFREVVRERIRRLVEERVAVPLLEEKWLRLDGSTVDVMISAVPFEFNGEPGVLAYCINISDRVRDEEEKRLLEEQVRQAQKMESVGRLAGGVAHDFNNLLTIINGYSDLLLRDVSPDKPNYDFVVEIHRAGERAVGITRQLLAFSRKDVIAPKVLDPNVVIRELEPMLRRLLGESIGLTLNLAPEAGLVFSDASWLTQVLLNLAVNSRDAMPSGGELTIETAAALVDPDYCRRNAAARPGEAVRITVRDTGCGMDEETRHQIFEPFFTTKPLGKGTGLGLSIVYGIVKSSGGWIDVKSRPGAGTSISIYLPVSNRAAAPPAAPGDMRSLQGKETVLLVEDDETVRGFAETALARFGYDVVACASAEDAVERASRLGRPVQVLLTDLMMPGLSGIQLAALLLERTPSLRVIFMSGYSRENLSAPEAARLHQAYVSKPFTAETLALAIRSVLDGTSARERDPA
jgi:two-component system, cell cycle sensor histidine kinase and response regulator CckA